MCLKREIIFSLHVYKDYTFLILNAICGMRFQYVVILCTVFIQLFNIGYRIKNIRNIRIPFVILDGIVRVWNNCNSLILERYWVFLCCMYDIPSRYNICTNLAVKSRFSSLKSWINLSPESENLPFSVWFVGVCHL